MSVLMAHLVGGPADGLFQLLHAWHAPTPPAGVGLATDPAGQPLGLYAAGSPPADLPADARHHLYALRDHAVAAVIAYDYAGEFDPAPATDKPSDTVPNRQR